MRRLTFLLALSLAAGPLAQAGENLQDRANQLLVKASEVSERKAKHHQEATVTAYHLKGGDASGKYVKDWVAAEEWREVMQIGDFSETRLRRDRKIYIAKNADFEPLFAEELRRMLPPNLYRLDAGDVVKEIGEREMNGIKEQCIRGESVVGKEKQKFEICVDAVTGSVLSRSFGVWRQEYADFVKFGDKLLPTKAVLFEKNQKMLEAQVSTTEDPNLSLSSYTPPPGAEIRETCIHREMPVALRSPDPEYPSKGAQRDGDVVLQAKINEKGQLIKLMPIQTLGEPYDTNAIKAVEKWQFESAKCDGVPYTEDVKIQVSFHPHR